MLAFSVMFCGGDAANAGAGAATMIAGAAHPHFITVRRDTRRPSGLFVAVLGIGHVPPRDRGPGAQR